MTRAPFKETEASRPDFTTTPFTYTKPPNPSFRPGGGLNSLPGADAFRPDSKWRTLVPEEHGPMQVYKMLMGAISPRPVAFVSTVSSDGVRNVAPFSFFNVLSPYPVTIVVSFAHTEKGMKDTTKNILETKGFTVGIISETWVEAANIASVDAPPDVDEFALAGLTPRASEVVAAPHVAEAAVSLEAELLHSYHLKAPDGTPTGTVILATVKRIHAKDFIFDENDEYRVLTERLRPVSRLGGISYGRITEAYDLVRPTWADIGQSDDVQAALNAAKDGKDAKASGQ
ncbi:hypothetical protein Q8F55_008294 [Vanrija albida]|uniref:Flavin reductase like domain-containing protein n=1 Tax=Vanrija albida TaxID=181172 RepID=A0ABR3PVZ1_9TREE